VKPANVMIEATTSAPKLVDFGIARRFTARAGRTATGTLGYAPMEQWLGHTEPRSDLYALGLRR
jgi:serine/threonine protein kinase